jgi:drug/metabolite transporter (DMT)-like permease
MIWLFYALGAAITWGFNYTFAERVLKYKISSVSLMVLQMILGSLVFGVLGSKTQFKQDMTLMMNNRNVLWLVVFSIISYNLGNWLIFLSIQSKDATTAGLIEISYPIFTVIITYLLFGENHINIPVVVGGLFILSGVGIITLLG